MNGDAPGFCGLGLGQRDFEHAVAIFRLGVFRLDRHGERDGALEAAVGALHETVLPLFFLALEPFLAADHEFTVEHLDFEILSVEPGNLDADFERIVGLVDVGTEHRPANSTGRCRYVTRWAFFVVALAGLEAGERAGGPFP